MTNLEYRFNFFTDAILQPTATALIEVALWHAIFATAATSTIGGFTSEYYFSYVLWAAFIGRIATSWMYEFRMIEEVDSGSINSLLVRPISFYEYYLSQLFGYKVITTMVSLIIPVSIMYYYKLPFIIERVPITLALVFYYLILVHTMSFCVATIAFHLNRIHSITMAKNLGLWLLSGELIPLDLLPEPYRGFLISLPFSNAVYTPVGYITGRFGIEVVYNGFLSITVGILVLTTLGSLSWNWGIRKYTGTGA